MSFGTCADMKQQNEAIQAVGIDTLFLDDAVEDARRGNEVLVGLAGVISIRASAGRIVDDAHVHLPGPLDNLLIVMLEGWKEIGDLGASHAKRLELLQVGVKVSAKLLVGDERALWSLPRAVKQVFVGMWSKVVLLFDYLLNYWSEIGVCEEIASQEEAAFGVMSLS